MPSVEIEGDETLRLTTALLIYEHSDDGDMDKHQPVITRHGVSNGVIQAGSAIDVKALRKILDRGVQSAAESSGWAWQFPRMLAENSDRVMWWSPAGIKSVFIGGDGHKPKVIKSWIPNLAWCASRTVPHCFLWAYDGEGAPDQQTDVYLPQFGPDDGMNHIHQGSDICVGTMRLRGYQPQHWEKAFWESKFKKPGNLKFDTPYACKEKFKSLGPLSAVLARIKTPGK